MYQGDGEGVVPDAHHRICRFSVNVTSAIVRHVQGETFRADESCILLFYIHRELHRICVTSATRAARFGCGNTPRVGDPRPENRTGALSLGLSASWRPVQAKREGADPSVAFSETECAALRSFHHSIPHASVGFGSARGYTVIRERGTGTNQTEIRLLHTVRDYRSHSCYLST